MNYTVVAPRNADENAVFSQRPLSPFCESTLEFIHGLSSKILLNKSFRKYPELMAMAFWMRRANIAKLRESFEKERGNRVWLPRGVAFHIAPSNVDSIFIYSWFISMLVGNINIVRISSKSNEQIDNLISLINDQAADDKYAPVRSRFMVVRYEHDDKTTAHFSGKCDIRVIWGGDETISRIRAIPIKPAAAELVFADKFSFAAVNAASFDKTENKAKIIDNFYNDAFWFGQNACSSPRMIVWVGNDDAIESARSQFWRLLENKIIDGGMVSPPSIAVDKLVVSDLLAARAHGNVLIEKSQTSLINRALLTDARDIDRGLHCGGGLFYEMKAGHLSEIANLTSEKDQTLAVFGFEAGEIKALLENESLKGINRVVPFGEALNFSAIWDGYDLLREFGREIQISI